QNERKVSCADATAGTGQAACVGHGLPIIIRCREVSDLRGTGQLGLLSACEPQKAASRPFFDQVVCRDLDCRRKRTPWPEYNFVSTFDGIEEVCELQRLERLTRRHHPIDRVPGKHSFESARLVVRKPSIIEEACQEVTDGCAGDA